MRGGRQVSVGARGGPWLIHLFDVSVQVGIRGKTWIGWGSGTALLVDAPVALLAHHREAREHEGIEVAVDGPAHAAEVAGQVVESDAAPTPGQSLDQLPLPRELVPPHRCRRAGRAWE
jgi:hypothetical protein